MLNLAELRGSVTVEIDGIDGASVGTFVVPIAVLSQATEGDTHTVAVGTPEDTLRTGILAAFNDALNLALDSIPTAAVEPAQGWGHGDTPHAETYIPTHPTPARSAHLYAEAADRIDTEGVGGSNP